MKNIVLVSVVATGITTLVQANCLSFIDRDFDAFCTRMVPQAHRLLFADYYQDLIKKIEGLKKENQIEERQCLYTAAINKLKKDHKVWADDINAFLTNLAFLDKSYDQDRHEVRMFLERYGAYKVFEENKGIQVVVHDAENNNFDVWWQQLKTQVTRTAERVTGWFKSIRGAASA